MLNRIVKDRELTSSDEIEEAIPILWNDLTVDDVQSVLRSMMSRLSSMIENGGEYIHESNGIYLLMFNGGGNRWGQGLSLPPVSAN
jgi:hypothetical protein